MSYGYCVEVRNDSLKYVLSEVLRDMIKDKRHIEIEVKNDEDTYIYTLEVFDNGSSSIDVLARHRDRISYTGDMEFGK